MINPRIQRLIAPLVSPPVFDFWAAKINPLWSWDRALARVVSAVTGHDGNSSLVLCRPNGHFRAPGPEQWLPVTLEAAGRRRTQLYRAAPPRSDGLLEIRANDGPLMAAAPGDILALGAPADDAPVDASDNNTFQVVLHRSGRALTLSSRQSLLNGLEQQGLSPAHGCRRGLCNSCACVRLRGHTLDRRSGHTTGDPNTVVRLCVSQARSDLLLDL